MGNNRNREKYHIFAQDQKLTIRQVLKIDVE